MTVRKLLFAVGLTAITLLLLAFPFGPLMPWSPVRPGYRTTAFAGADIITGESDPVLAAYGGIDEIISEAERYHSLKFNSRVKVIACRSWSDCGRYLPWMSIRGLGGVTLATGDVIYITPRLREKGLDPVEFLRHELSHAVVSQNTGIIQSFKMVEQGWFAEGMAVSFGRQRAYLTREEFLRQAEKTDLAAVIDPERMDRAGPAWSAKLAYVAQSNFIEYLQHEAGRDTFQRFLLAYIKDPDNYRNLFEESFHIPFPEAIVRFQRSIRDGKWPLKEDKE
ncbi:MAG: hypothetical protein AB7H86_08805 [Blastocatellales bacterium]